MLNPMKNPVPGLAVLHHVKRLTALMFREIQPGTEVLTLAAQNNDTGTVRGVQQGRLQCHEQTVANRIPFARPRQLDAIDDTVTRRGDKWFSHDR
jgi:hypothetical protein